MDFAKFHEWKYNASLVAMYPNGSVPDTCKEVFEQLVADGLAKADNVTGVHGVVPGLVLTDAGMLALPKAKRLATRLLNELVKENDKLVHKLVNQIFKKSLNFTEEEDLYQAGLMAFVHALGKFDPSRFSRKGLGSSFATYVRHWIRDYTQKSMTRQQPIQHPKGYGMPYSVHRRAEDILSKTGRVAEAHELGTFKVRGKEYPVTEDLMLKWRTAQNVVVSLDGHWDSSDRDNEHRGMPLSVLANTVYAKSNAPGSSKTPEALFLAQEQAKIMEALVLTLTSDERRVLSAMREGEGSDRKIAMLLECGDEKARALKASIVEKLSKREKRLS